MFSHIHQALAQVRELQARVVENQRFRGWSGRGRLACGGLAVATALVLQSGRVGATPAAHFAGWAVLCVVCLVISAGAMAYWFLFDPAVRRDVHKLRPLWQILPPLGVGGVLTAALATAGQYDWLPGVWMLNFGLANVAARQVLPRPIMLVGGFYLAAGTVCLFAGLSFLNPWPMAVVFGVGELAAGLILHFDQRRCLP